MNRTRSFRTATRVLTRSIYSLEAAKRLGEMLDEWQPDVAHLHSIHGHLTLSVLVELNRRGIPVVWTLHDYRLLCPNTQLMVRGQVCERCSGGRVWNCAIHRCKKDSAAASLVASVEAYVEMFVGVAKRVECFIAPSAFLLSEFRRFGWDTSRFVHLGNFVPAARVVTERCPATGSFVYAGQLVQCKGVHTLIRAVGQIEGATLEIAGTGADEQQLRALAEEVAPDRVAFHGHVSAHELAALRRTATAVVVPSEWFENSPYAVTEAFGAGCPVVAADIGGLPELVIHDENGLLFAPGDVSSLANALTLLKEDSQLVLRLADRAAAAATSMELGEYVEALEQIYEQAVRRGFTER